MTNKDSRDEVPGPKDSSEVKQDQGKLRYDLLPYYALDKVAEVFTFGETKYPSINGVQNWLHHAKISDIPRYEAALGRHYSLHMQGEYIDEESGVPHMASICFNSLVIIELKNKFKGVKDV